jgi:hypothetical protein
MADPEIWDPAVRTAAAKANRMQFVPGYSLVDPDCLTVEQDQSLAAHRMAGRLGTAALKFAYVAYPGPYGRRVSSTRQSDARERLTKVAELLGVVS